MAVAGYAIKDRDGHLLFGTITESERGTKVAYIQAASKMQVPDYWSRETISDIFEPLSMRKGDSLVRVSIEELE